MANGQLGTVMQYIRRLVVAKTTRDLTDRELLHRYCALSDEGAFVALVQRHAQLVWGVCRQVLHHEQDAEDAWQASILVLARYAPTIRKAEALASWLHGVAYRTALMAKRQAAIRRAHERRERNMPHQKPDADVTWRELQAVLAEEVQRLPEKYRAPFVLCCLEGKSKLEAAQELGWKEGTVSGRLAQARKQIQQRLVRRGMTLSAVLCTAALTRSAVEAALVNPTIRAALLFAADKTAAAGIVSGHVAALAEGVTQAMFATKVKIATVFILALGLVIGGAGVATHRQAAAQAAADANQKPEATSQKPEADAKKPTAKDDKDAITVRGRVLDPDGEPFAGAELYLGGHTNLLKEKKQKYPVRATSGDDGAFEFTFAKSELEKIDPDDSAYQILAVAKGYGCAWVTADSAAERLTLRLVKDEPVSGRIMDSDGKPVAGAKLTVIGVCTGKDGKSAEAIRYGLRDVFGTCWVGPLPGQPTVLTTGADGNFRLAGVGRDRAVCLRIEGRGISTEAVEAHGASFEYRADVSRPIRGVVRDQATGKRLAGVTLVWQPTYNRRYAVMPLRYHMAITDKEGRYELLGVTKSSTYGAGSLEVRPAAGQLYLQRTVPLKDTDTPGLDPKTVDIELVQGGVIVSGKVTNKATGRPIAEALVEYYPVHPNPYASKLPILSYPRSEAITGPDGSYTLTVFPGPGVIGVVASTRAANGVKVGNAYMEAHVTREEIKAFFKTPVSSYDEGDQIMLYAYGGGAFDALPPVMTHVYGSDALVLLEPSEKDKALVKDVTLEPAQERKGRLVGPDGQPLTGVTAWGLSSGNIVATETTLKGPEFTVRGLNPKAPRQLSFYHKDKNLGFFLKDLPAEKDGPLIVKLQPCGSLSGRIVDQDGQPVAGVRLNVSRNGPGPYRDVTTDAQGRFRADGLVPGPGYLVVHHFGGILRANDMVMESGKNKDLGDLKLGN